MSYNASVVGSPTFGAAKFSNGLTAVSDANYLALPTGALGWLATDNWTIEGQVKTTGTATTIWISSGNLADTNALWIGAVSGKFAASVTGSGAFTGGAALDSTILINDNALHHVAVSMAGGTTLKLFVDGVLGATFTGVMTVFDHSNGDIGRFANNVGFAWPGAIDEVALWNSTKYTANFTPPSSAYTGSEANLRALYHLQADGTDSATSTLLIVPNNAAVIYSPYNWNTNATDAFTINSGAYFKTLFTGTTCVLNFDVTNNLTPLPQIWSRIDNGPWTQSTIATTVTLTIPAATLSNADIPYHRLDVLVKSTTETRNRWNTTSATAVDFRGITLDSGASVVAPIKFPKNVIIYGDSITEGVRTVGEAAANDTDRNDSMFTWTYVLGELLGAEIGNIGFGGSGFSVTGSGNVPILTSSYNLLYQSVSRTFSPVPDLIVCNDGTNDGATNTTSAITTFLNAILAACANKPIVLLRPFPATQGGQQEPFMQAAAAACNNPSLVHYVTTSGFFNTTYGADSGNVHPSGPNSTYLIGPQVASALLPFISSAGGPVGNNFGGGFLNG